MEMENCKPMNQYLVGVDPGVQTGISVKRVGSKELAFVDSMGIISAMDYIEYMHGDIFVIVEDARLWNGRKKRMKPGEMQAKSQGAGFVKGYCSVWDEFLELRGYNYKMVPPSWKGAKLNATMFKKVTGWQKRTNEHSRDAAMLIFPLTERDIINFFNFKFHKNDK